MRVSFLDGGTRAWEAAGFALFKGVNVPSKTFGELVEHAYHTPRITVGELARMQADGDDIIVVDGRPYSEYHRMNIPGGICCPNAELPYRIGSLVKSPRTKIIVNCAGRTRSILGAQTLINFGVPNPVHALGRAVARLSAYPAPKRPRTTFNVGRIEGGSGVNVIPRDARMDVDLRSESPVELGRLDAFFRRAARESAEDENASRRQGAPALDIDIRLIGDRPGGVTPPEQTLVRLAAEATRTLGARPYLDCSSTDSNIAISRGLPAVTIGAGGTSGNTHTLDEWYDPTGRDLGLQRALLVALGVVGLKQ
jgi:rhodanese-related sulfurtransferase